MVFGLFAFIFRLQSRREMNRELTAPAIQEHLRTLFPDINSIPHADTLVRYLQNLNPKRIEEIHITLIRKLIRNKKFKHILSTIACQSASTAPKNSTAKVWLRTNDGLSALLAKVRTNISNNMCLC